MYDTARPLSDRAGYIAVRAADMAGDSKALVKKEGGNRKERRANEKSKVDNTHRRTWDKDDYEERAAAREKVLASPLHSAAPIS